MTPCVAMRIRFARWRALAMVARLAHGWARSGARPFAWSARPAGPPAERPSAPSPGPRRSAGGARHAGTLAERLSAPAAVATARRALLTVPAYRELVGDAAVGSVARGPGDWLAALPVTTKRSYVDRFPLAARCTGGAIPRSGCELDESAGSSGAPYTWIRSEGELADVHRSLALLARHLLPVDERPFVVLNAFSMGAWATGTNVAVALRTIGTVKSCGPDVDKLLGTIALLGDEPA